VTLRLEDENKTDWLLPNSLSFVLKSILAQEWEREKFCHPMIYTDAQRIMTICVGLKGVYILPVPHQYNVATFAYGKDFFCKKLPFTKLSVPKEFRLHGGKTIRLVINPKECDCGWTISLCKGSGRSAENMRYAGCSLNG